MSASDIRVSGVSLAFHPYGNRVPLKFGREVSTQGETVRVCIRVRGLDGREAPGWGETPLAAAWSWPSPLPQAERVSRMEGFCRALEGAWAAFPAGGHPMEIGHSFIREVLPGLLGAENAGRPPAEEMSYLAALVCCSAFDLALYDAYGVLNHVKVFDCLNAPYMNHDLSWYYTEEYAPLFRGKYPSDFLVPPGEVPSTLPAWHLVGGRDPLCPGDLTGAEPEDGYPVLLRDWIRRDGLFCLKIKLTGTDAAWDYERIVRVGDISLETGVTHLTADFNCTVTDPAYVCGLMDRLKAQRPEIFDLILYIEQPFPYEIEKYPIDVRAVSARKLLLMDESAHDWRCVAMGHALGWTGVALKTCKTLTGALLSLCWARAHGMALMVQDLTNPRLAIIPHVLLAAHAGTIAGVEVNSMQFCPGASRAESAVHPGLYRRREGRVSLNTLGSTGFGYRLDEILAGEAGEEETPP